MEYLHFVRDTKWRRGLTKYSLSDYQFEFRDRKIQTWFPRKKCVCGHCSTGEVETEKNFLLHREKLSLIRDFSYREKAKKIPYVLMLTLEEKLSEGPYSYGTEEIQYFLLQKR